MSPKDTCSAHPRELDFLEVSFQGQTECNVKNRKVFSKEFPGSKGGSVGFNLTPKLISVGFLQLKVSHCLTHQSLPGQPPGASPNLFLCTHPYPYTPGWGTQLPLQPLKVLWFSRTGTLEAAIEEELRSLLASFTFSGPG